MLGRRGPVQAAFTNPELIELTELAGADLLVDPADLELDEASEAALADDRMAQRNLAVLREYAARDPAGKPRSAAPPVSAPRRSPSSATGRVEAVEVVRNRLVADEDGRLRAVPTDEREVIPCGIVLRSVGYLGVAIPGVPFDERRGVIPNDGGRVLDADGAPLPGVYCTGWIKRGPSGVIGTNKKDATETVELLLEDAATGSCSSHGRRRETSTRCSPRAASRSSTTTGWEAIDAAERARGEALGRPRVKLCSWDELLAAQAEPEAAAR